MSCCLGIANLAVALFLLGMAALPATAVEPPTSGDDLREHYYEIFKTGNRNAASHLWTSYILNFAHMMPAGTVEKVFRGFCPVSGSPLPDDPHTAYKVKVSSVTGDTVAGVSHHCCWPCICDLTELVRVDSKTIKTATGDQKYDFFVIGDPCKHESKLDAKFTDPFTNQEVSLRDEAPELKCEDGKLVGAHFSDNGYVIIGMLFTSVTDKTQAQQNPAMTSSVDPADPTSGYGEMCQARKQEGYNSGMGLIFHLVANINPIASAASPLNLNALPTHHETFYSRSSTSQIFGYSFLCFWVVGAVFVIHRLWKIFTDDASVDESTEVQMTEFE